MTTYRFPSDLGWTVGSTYSDAAPLNVGTVFALTTNINITGIRFYAGTNETVDAQLWENTTKVAEVVGFSAVTGWNTITFSSPYAGTTGIDYTASALMSTGTASYTAVTNKFTDGTSAVSVTVGPATSNSTANGKYTYGTTIPASTSGASGPWFGVDVILDDGGGSPDGSVTAVKMTGTGAFPAPTVVAGNGGAVTAVKMTGTGLMKPPTVTGLLSATVVAVKMTGSGSMVAPAIDIITTLTGGGAMAGTGAMGVPAVTGTGSVALPMLGTGAMPAPVVTGAAVVTAVKATGTGAMPAPVFGAAAIVVAVKMTATGLMPAPTVTGAFVINATVLAVRMTGTGAMRAQGAQVVETLPTNVGTGRVTGRFARARVLIGDADGIPNLFPISSAATDDTITFTSTAPIWLDTTATPAAVTILPEPIVCTLDSQGYMVDSAGHQYVDLVATNDAQLSPSNRKWSVVFSAGFGIPSFQMVVLESATVDLASLIPT